MLIYAQANRASYASASVLLLRWEDDTSVTADVQALHAVLQDRFNFRTTHWSIPTCPNPLAKLTLQLAQQIDFARPDHLLIIYYAGYGFVGSDSHLYWAWYVSGERERW